MGEVGERGEKEKYQVESPAIAMVEDVLASIREAVCLPFLLQYIVCNAKTPLQRGGHQQKVKGDQSMKKSQCIQHGPVLGIKDQPVQKGIYGEAMSIAQVDDPHAEGKDSPHQIENPIVGLRPEIPPITVNDISAILLAPFD